MNQPCFPVAGTCSLLIEPRKQSVRGHDSTTHNQVQWCDCLAYLVVCVMAHSWSNSQFPSHYSLPQMPQLLQQQTYTITIIHTPHCCREWWPPSPSTSGVSSCAGTASLGPLQQGGKDLGEEGQPMSCICKVHVPVTSLIQDACGHALLWMTESYTVASFPGHRRNSLATSTSSNCIRM